MCSALAKLEKAGSGGGPSKPYYGFGKLSIGYYEIESFRLVRNKFKNDGLRGKTILVELKNQVIFLPEYFMEEFSEDDVLELNRDGQKKFLYFGGRRENSK